jgi:hypothetical protein
MQAVTNEALRVPQFRYDQAVHVVLHEGDDGVEVKGERLAFKSWADLADNMHIERLRLLRVAAQTSERDAGCSRQKKNVREAVRGLA